MDEKKLKSILTGSVNKYQAPKNLLPDSVNKINILQTFYNLFELYFIVPTSIFGTTKLKGGELDGTN